MQTTDVIMRKRSERGYVDENIRDSIVMGELSSKFPDLGKLQTAAEDLIYFKIKYQEAAFDIRC